MHTGVDAGGIQVWTKEGTQKEAEFMSVVEVLFPPFFPFLPSLFSV